MGWMQETGSGLAASDWPAAPGQLPQPRSATAQITFIKPRASSPQHMQALHALRRVKYNSACVFKCFQKEGWKPVSWWKGWSRPPSSTLQQTAVSR